MIVVSAGLLLVSLVLLLTGLLGTGLGLIYLSILGSVLAFVFLLLGILQRRGESLSAGPERSRDPRANSVVGRPPAGADPDQANEDKPSVAPPGPVATVAAAVRAGERRGARASCSLCCS